MCNLWNEYADVATVVPPMTTGGTDTSRPNFMPCYIDQQHTIIYVVFDSHISMPSTALYIKLFFLTKRYSSLHANN
jgi:hypothetical protein